MDNAKIIAVDFDGTLVENKWPEIGAPIEKNIAKVKAEQEAGAKIIVACYESALRAYRSLERDGHSGMSVQITKSILNRLIDGKCLTPLRTILIFGLRSSLVRTILSSTSSASA